VCRQGTVWAPNIPGWKKYPLRQKIAAAISPQRIPVRIESDRACYILGEAWKGAARGCANAIFLAIGTGIGAGILVDGRVLNGADGVAGAAGWMALRRPFLPAYKDCGCFELHASGRGLAKSAGAPDARAVFEALHRNNAAGRNAVRQAVELWGMAAANLVSIFNPEKIVFGGGVFGPATRFLDHIRAEAEKWAQPLAMKRVKLEISALGSDAGLYGAAFIARQVEGTPK
jgi:glucokinase